MRRPNSFTGSCRCACVEALTHVSHRDCSVSWDRIKYADMHAKGIQLVFKYNEGIDLDFDIGLYFYEIVSSTLCL
jgi:hypothetical protein